MIFWWQGAGSSSRSLQNPRTGGSTRCISEVRAHIVEPVGWTGPGSPLEERVSGMLQARRFILRLGSIEDHNVCAYWLLKMKRDWLPA